ncbi:hypothetical protein CF65_01639 [Aggregatibacter actinomycetemcomitans HK1651]|nr:hypothetical protein CF65_01639 [Aggregatibacter actinomycetemcomitans HK1651]
MRNLLRNLRASVEVSNHLSPKKCGGNLRCFFTALFSFKTPYPHHFA